MAWGVSTDQPKSNFSADFVINKNLNLPSNYKFGGATQATAVDTIDTTGWAAEGDSNKITIAIPESAGGSGTTITLFLDITTATPSAGANEIAFGANSFDDANAARFLIRAINGETFSRIVYGNASGDGSEGVGIQGITPEDWATDVKTVTLTIDTGGEVGNITGAIEHSEGDIDLVKVEDFTGGLDSNMKQVPFFLNTPGPTNLRGRTTAYKVER